VPFYEFPQDASVVLQLSAGRRPSRLDIPQLTDPLWSIMQECWSQNPSTRPEANALPGKISHISNRTLEGADSWDGLLSSQLYKAVQHPELCPSGSRLESFLFEPEPPLPVPILLSSIHSRNQSGLTTMDGSSSPPPDYVENLLERPDSPGFILAERTSVYIDNAARLVRACPFAYSQFPPFGVDF